MKNDTKNVIAVDIRNVKTIDLRSELFCKHKTEDFLSAKKDNQERNNQKGQCSIFMGKKQETESGFVKSGFPLF
jgi:hypothetical protein